MYVQYRYKIPLRAELQECLSRELGVGMWLSER
jgi:hypothetical protein